jgi:hypothetical protein
MRRQGGIVGESGVWLSSCSFFDILGKVKTMLAVETSHQSRKLDVGILRRVSQECLGVHLWQ